MKPKLRKVTAFFKSTTSRLALSYLTIIMLMSLGFSAVLYDTSSKQLGRQIPPDNIVRMRGENNEIRDRREFDMFFEERIAEGRNALLQRLIALNLIALTAGSTLSYYLARKTLGPIEESIEAQMQFVSDASHELRTPLTAMQTINEVALRRSKITDESARDIIKQNVEEIIKLRTLTNSLLYLAKTDTADFSKLTSLQDIATEAMNRIVGLAQEKNISIEDSVANIKVAGNLQQLAQIIVILLDNAIKYSPKRTTIYLKSEKKGKYALLHVRDEGPGIRPYDIRKIFERFYRADQSRSRQLVEGHGIGLSLARKIARQHAGDILVNSAVGKGSTFTLKLVASD